MIDKETLWAGSPVPVNDHNYKCKCENCIIIRWLKAEKEVVALHKILEGQKQKWVTMVMVEGVSQSKWYTDEAIKEVKALWASCQVPDSHLEDPDDILPKLLRYTQAIDAGLREKNWNAFVFGNRFAQGENQMNEADKQYATYDIPEEEHDPWEFLGQQIKGLIALALFVCGLWMLVGAAVFK